VTNLDLQFLFVFSTAVSKNERRSCVRLIFGAMMSDWLAGTLVHGLMSRKGHWTFRHSYGIVVCQTGFRHTWMELSTVGVLHLISCRQLAIQLAICTASGSYHLEFHGLIMCISGVVECM